MTISREPISYPIFLPTHDKKPDTKKPGTLDTVPVPSEVTVLTSFKESETAHWINYTMLRSLRTVQRNMKSCRREI